MTNDGGGIIELYKLYDPIKSRQENIYDNITECLVEIITKRETNRVNNIMTGVVE